MFKRSIILLICLWLSIPTQAHHWFQERHDVDILVTVEVEVSEFRFINPHPFISVRIVDSMNEPIDKYGDQGAQWDLQLDNRWELQQLGFTKETLLAGEKIIVSAHPGIVKKNIMYVKAINHPRLGFRYEHNVRQLLELQ